MSSVSMSYCNPRDLFPFPNGWRVNGASGARYVMLVLFCRGSNRTVFVSELRTIPHYGLCCDYDNGKFRPALKVIVLVQGKDRSTVQDCAAGKKISTAVCDPFNATFAGIVNTYSTEAKLLDFKLDRNLAAAVVTSNTENQFEIDYLKILEKEDLPTISAAWECLVCLVDANPLSLKETY